MTAPASTSGVFAAVRGPALEDLLEQLELCAREVIGVRVTIELASPLVRGAGWRAHAREFGVAHLECGGRGPLEAAIELGRELVGRRGGGVETEELQRLLREAGAQ